LRSGARQSSKDTSQSRSVPKAGMMPKNRKPTRKHREKCDLLIITSDRL